MSMYASANSRVDRLIQKAAEILLHGWPRLPIRDEQKQERLKKQRREIWGDPLLSLPMENENLSAWTLGSWNYCWLGHRIAADKHKPKGYQLRVPLKEIAADSTCQCERLAAKTTPERDAKFYSEQETAEKEMPDLNVTEQDMALFSAAFHPNQAKVHKYYSRVATLDISVLC